MSDIITFVLDGQRVSPRGLSATTTVLDYLRDYLSKKGTKEGCAEGDCGACTVVVVDLFEEQIRYRSINSCIQFLPTLDGKILFSVESLRSPQGELHPAQRAMVECHGSQCGFCTPGFVMSLFALFRTNAQPTRLEISDALSGNLCRCTGYRPILDAGEKMYEYAAVEDTQGSHLPLGSDGLQAFEQGLMETLRSLQSEQRSKVFEYPHQTFFAPVTLADAAKCIAESPNAVILAGGTDIGLWVTKQQRDLETLVYLGKVAALEAISATNEYLEIGAAAPLERAFSQLLKHYPELQDLYKRFASLPIRNAGTLVGNLANGSPIGDAAPALIVLGATILLRKGEQQRELALDAFYLDYMQKDLAPGEFVEAVRVPLPSSTDHHFRVYKITKRFEQDISAVCAAFYAQIEDGIVSTIRVCFGGMAATSKRANACEQALLGQSWDMDTVALAMEKLADDYSPLSDMRASANYRLTVAQNLLKKFYLESTEPNLTIDVRV